MIEQSGRAYASRDAALREMKQIKLLSDSEQAQFDKRWQQINASAPAKGSSVDNETAMLLKKVNLGGSLAISREVTDADLVKQVKAEADLKKRVVRGAWSIAKDKTNMQLSVEKVQSYEEAFKRIKAETGIDDLGARCRCCYRTSG